MLNRLPLNTLNTFAAAAEHLSFQDAATSLHVTPSAVSHQIRNLEGILGYKLFERLDKAVSLTPQGERLFTEIRQPIRQIHEASRRALRGRDDHTLALSVAPVFATSWLLPRLKMFYNQHPEISLSIVATTEYADFGSDPFDASIRMGSGDWADTASIHLMNQSLVAVCHPDLIKHHLEPLTASEVANYPLIINSYIPKAWDEWFFSAGVEMPNQASQRLQVQGAAQVVEAVQSKDSIGLVDRNLFPQDLASGRICEACDHVLEDGEGYFLIYPEANGSLAALQTFKHWLSEQLSGEATTNELS